ncbi:MAG: 5-formyltetrahydrofolate cyclo-ligase [Lachnospiraceae bacterium]|nr:5-formyltetrahydrofolate cyclo-ligase [Lachnospiraceae bacterium]
MTLMDAKKRLRTEYRKMRDALPEEHRTSASLSACRAFRDRFFTAVPCAYDRFFLFASCGSELLTDPLFSFAREAGLTVLYPRVFGREMLFCAVASPEDMKISHFGIREPEDAQDALWVSSKDTTSRDLMVVPGLVFDPSLQRLGYGGGYYDRYLQDFKGTVCGIGFASQRYEKQIPAEETDIPLTCFCCEEGFYEPQGVTGA